METEEEKEHQKLQEMLFQEVPSSVPHMDPTVNPTDTIPMSMPIPVATVNVSEASSSSLPTDADEQMKAKLDKLRQPVVEENPEKKQKDTPIDFDIPTSKPPTYPGLDGHPRRITPIPIIPIRKEPEQPTPEQLERVARVNAEMAEVWERQKTI